jgi:hypothetical protein
VDASGNVYVADIGNAFIEKFTEMTVNPCVATLSRNFALSVPILTHAGQAYWADFAYAQNTMAFALTNAGVVTDMSLYGSCTPATLSTNLQLQIPVVMFSGTSYWANFQYGNGVTFILTGVGAN